MASNRSVAEIRKRAKGYSDMSIDYAHWAPHVKKLVRRANDEDWGTFIAACVLLEDIIPRDEQQRVERRIQVKDYAEEYVKQKANEGKVNHFVYFAVAGLFAALACLLSYSIADTFGIRLNSLSPVFTTIGSVAFSLVGGAFSGCAVGSYVARAKDGAGPAMVLSCLSGFGGAIVCLLFPPVSLIAAWAAWRSSSILKPRVMHDLTNQASNREVHGQRVFARSPKAPDFVKNAMRLSGIYQGDDGYIGELAREALGRRQSDYGAFIAYNAILDAHHKAVQEKMLEDESWEAREVDGGESEGAVETGDGWDGPEGSATATAGLGNDANRADENNRYGALFAGVLSALLVAVAIWSVVDFDSLFSRPYITGIVIAIVVVCSCFVAAIIGWRSSTRVVSIHGLHSTKKRVASAARSAWFAAWFLLIFVFGAFIMLAR